MKALSVMTEAVTLIGKGRCNMTCFVCEVYEINSKIFFFSRQYFWGLS